MTFFFSQFRPKRARNRWKTAGECVGLLACFLAISGATRGQGAPADDSKSPREWVAVLRGDDAKAREAARWALYRLGPKAKDAIPDLIAAMDDSRKAVREWALEALQAMGPAAAPAAAALARKLGDASLEYTMAPVGTGHVAAYILGQIGAPAVPALIEALESDSRRARRWAAETLAQIGPAAKDAVPALRRDRPRGTGRRPRASRGPQRSELLLCGRSRP